MSRSATHVYRPRKVSISRLNKLGEYLVCSLCYKPAGYLQMCVRCAWEQREKK